MKSPRAAARLAITAARRGKSRTLVAGIVLLALPAIGLHALSRGYINGAPDAPQGGIFYTVNTTSDTVVGGACANGNPGCSLRGAIQTANSHPGADGIGLDLPAGSVINLTGVLPDLTDGVSISGPGANMLTVRRNTGGNYRIFNVTATGVVAISGMTISNGLVSGSAGGAGVTNSGTGTVTISNCIVSGNSSLNSSGNGGGIYNISVGAIMNVINSTLIGNLEGTIPNGDIYNDAGTLNVTNSTISDNDQNGIYSRSGTVNVTNSTIDGNDFAGIEVLDGTLNVTNSTIAHNRSGGINHNFHVPNIGTWTVKSSIIALNTSFGVGDANGVFTSGGFNLIGNVDNSNGFTQSTDQLGTTGSPLDPKFDPNDLQNNGGPTQTIALRSGSPAIDKGTSNGLSGHLTTDQRSTGFPRTFDNPSVTPATGGDNTDIGAFELGLEPVSVSRKTHGATVFDISLPLAGTAGVECRRNTGSDTSGPNAGRDHELILTFASPVTLGTVSVTSNDITDTPTATSNVSSNVVTVDLHNIPNARRLTINLTNVSDGTNTNNVSVPMGVLLGDASGNGSVNASDVSLTKLKSGQTVDGTNFRTDVTVSNSINSSDVSTVKLKSGTALP